MNFIRERQKRALRPSDSVTELLAFKTDDEEDGAKTTCLNRPPVFPRWFRNRALETLARRVACTDRSLALISF